MERILRQYPLRGEHGKGRTLTIQPEGKCMCGLVLLSESGEIIDWNNLDSLSDVCIGVGRLLKSDDGADIEIVRLKNEGCRNYEVVSDRVVRGNLEEVRTALQDLGFSLLESICRKIFDFIQIQMPLGLSEEKST